MNHKQLGCYGDAPKPYNRLLLLRDGAYVPLATILVALPVIIVVRPNLNK